MKRVMLSSILAIGLVSLLLSSPDAGAAGFIHKTVQCPKSGFTLVPVGARFQIKDLIISSSGVTDVSLRFGPPQLILADLFMGANQTVVSNFGGQVESEEEQALKLTCGGVATVSVTLVGTARL